MSILFPAYLAGLLGLALPWLLHRFSDQQPEEQLFPSKRFLEETAPPVSRQRRLKYLALLALRIASLLLLCFLFAQPWLNSAGSIGQARMHHFVVIDQSFSMRAEDRWSRAVDKAQELLSDLPDADEVSLIGFDSSPRVLSDNPDSSDGVASTSAGAAAAAETLSELRPGFSSGDYGLLMQRLDQLASEQVLPVKVWLISDAQHSALPAQLNALYAPQLASFELLSIAGEEAFNVHLSAQAQSLDGVNVRLSVQLNSSAAVVAARATDQPSSVSSAGQDELLKRSALIEVSFKDQLLASERVEVMAGRTDTVVFDELILPPGNQPVLQVSVRTLDEAGDTLEDALSEDNALAIVVFNANPTPVALLQSNASVSSNASVFLSTALETDAMAEVDSLAGTAEQVSPEVPHIVSGRVLDGPNIDLDIRQFVDTGSNALVFDSSTSRSRNDLSLLGRELGVVDETHPLALGDIDWFGTLFYDLTPMTVLDGDLVLLETSEQEPILLERPSGRGKLLLLNDRLDGVSSNLPLQPAFVSLMQSLLRYFDASTALPRQLLVGQRLPLPANVQVLDTAGEPLLTLDASGRSGNVQLTEPGLYTIIGVRGEHSLSVLTDPREADLGKISESALTAWQARYDDTIDQTEASTTLPVLAHENRISLWALLLPLLMLVMLLESWFGNQGLDIRRDGS